MVRCRKKWRAADVSKTRCEAQMRRDGSGVSGGGIALVVEEIYAKAGINRGLIRIRRRTVHLIQAEACKQRCLVGHLVIDPHGKLVRVGHDFG